MPTPLRIYIVFGWRSNTSVYLVSLFTFSIALFLFRDTANGEATRPDISWKYNLLIRSEVKTILFNSVISTSLTKKKMFGRGKGRKGRGQRVSMRVGRSEKQTHNIPKRWEREKAKRKAFERDSYYNSIPTSRSLTFRILKITRPVGE